VNHCPECGAPLGDLATCDELFHQLLAWEQSNLERNGRYHHLLVMSWELQHPSRFAEETLAWARESLRRAIRDGVPAAQLRREVAQWAGQDRRDFKITATGVEPVARHWSRTMADTVAEGEEAMPDSIMRWATAVLADLERAGEV